MQGSTVKYYRRRNLGLFEVNEAAELIAEATDPDANIIFGAVIDEALRMKSALSLCHRIRSKEREKNAPSCKREGKHKIQSARCRGQLL